MFAGIVSIRGRVESIPSVPPGQLVISHPEGWASLTVGDSLAVNGCCLTAVAVASSGVGLEVMPETLRRTSLGGLSAGDPVNLEAALRLQDAVGGHLVSGHVDATGRVAAVRPEGNATWVSLEVPPEVARYCVLRGSIAVDGCSLTLVRVEDRPGGGALVEVSLIPHTMAATVAAEYRPGTIVNLEADLVAKLVERLVEPHLGTAERGDMIPADG